MNSGLHMASASSARCDGSSPHPIPRLRAAHQDGKQSLLHLGRIQMLPGNIVLAFASPTIDHRNLMCLGIPADAAAETARQAHQVVVVEGLIGAG